MTLVNAFANFGITFGYIIIGFAILPHFDVKRWWVTLAGVGFFVTCGITHADMGLGHLMDEPIHHGDSVLMTINHVVQLVAVWAFMVGLYLEFVKEWSLD